MTLGRRKKFAGESRSEGGEEKRERREREREFEFYDRIYWWDLVYNWVKKDVLILLHRRDMQVLCLRLTVLF